MTILVLLAPPSKYNWKIR